MLVKTNQLIEEALDWAVAKCEGIKLYSGPRDNNPAYKPNWVRRKHGDLFQPSTDWSQGEPILDREKIKLGWVVDHWVAQKDFNYNKSFYGRDPHHPLIAAMRCYVASKLGDEIEIPDALDPAQTQSDTESSATRPRQSAG